MSRSPELSNPRLDHILHVLVVHRKLWLFPGLVALAMSWVYVYFIRSETYTARQTLIVRDDLLGQSLKPGQFESLDLMKSAQETILEISRKPQVVRNALKKIGPSSTSWFGGAGADWPSEKTIEDVQKSIALSAPNGAEFGHTETVVLSTKSNSRERAALFVLALLDEIDVKINEVRELRLSSMKDELTVIRDSARESLTASAERLRAMELEFGPDLPTVRSLSDPQSGEGTMAQTLLQIRSERRQFENRLHSARNQRETLVAATHDPDAILATSDELFKFQPALSRLKQELIEAQSALADSYGRYEQAHPQFQKNLEQVRSMRRQIHDELDSAKRGLESQITSLTQRVEELKGEEESIENLFNKLSAKRVDYLRLEEEVKKKSEVFNEAQGNLASIQRLDSSDVKVKLLTPVDEPQVSTRADGLGKTTTILGGGLAGFIAGFGLVLLLAPGPDQELSPREKPSTTPPTQPKTATPAPQSNPDATTPPRTSPAPLNVASPPTSATTEVPSAIKIETQPSTVAKKQIPVVTKPVTQVPLSPTPRPKPTSGETATEPVTKTNTPEPTRPKAGSRLTEIQAEIDLAVAKSESTSSSTTANSTTSKATPDTAASPKNSIQNSSSAGKTTPEVLDSSQMASLSPPTTRETVPPEPIKATKAAPSIQSEVAEFEKSLRSARRQADSTGVPTAASILAALDKVRPSVGSSAGPIIIPQEDSTPNDLSNPELVITPIQSKSAYEELAGAQKPKSVTSSVPEPINIKSSVDEDDSKSRELELRRRLSQRPLDIVKQDAVESADSIPSPEVTAPSNTPNTNPFLNNSAGSNHEPSATAQQMLTQAKAEAERQGMVAPVSPIATHQETTDSSRMSAATVPIPDQIKQLTDSIASFAKPIQRVNEPTQDDEF